jgi:group I intron endonuclease
MSAKELTPAIPVTSGIYQIRCRRNGKIHGGSSVNLRARWDTHRRDLRQRTHANPHLQHARKLFGESSFEFRVLEYVDRTRLLGAEVESTRSS